MKAKKILVFLLVLLTALSFSACKGNETDGIDTLPADKALDVSGFTIIRADEAEQAVVDAATELREKIKEVCGHEIGYDTDWVKKGQEIPADSKEIIVGQTNRMSSEEIRTNDFKIIREGDKIYIIGGSDEATVNAVEYFIANLIHENGILIPDKTDHLSAGKYTVEKLYFGKTEIKALTVCNTAKNSVNTVRTSGFMNLFEDMTGIKVKKTYKEENANIILRDFDASKVKDGDWGTVTADGKLELYLGDDTTDALALKYYISTALESCNGEMKFKTGDYSGKTLSKEEFLKQDNLTIYPEFPDRIYRDYQYTVSVTKGDKTAEIPVYDHAFDSYMNRNGEGSDRHRRFSTFAFSGEGVRVDIKVNKSFSSYSVMPSVKNFKHEFKDGVISVYLDKPEYFVLRLDDSDDSILSVFADYPEYPFEVDTDDDNTMVIDGWVDGNIRRGITTIDKAGTTVYIKAGSVFNSKIDIMADDVRVIGRGAVVDPFGNALAYNINAAPGKTLVQTMNDNTVVDGIHMLNARSFNFEAIGKSKDAQSIGTRVYNTKILSTEICSDGITFCWESKDSLAERCFVYNGDNALVFEENCTYRDITVGTTCAAMYPQTDVVNVSLEGIHVFRADDGIIDNIWNGSGEGGIGFGTGKDAMKFENVVIDGVDAVDCVYAPRFFRGQNQGQKLKDITIKNVSLGNMKSQSMSHIIALYQTGFFTDNYNFKLINFAIDGKMVDKLAELRIYEQGDVTNKFSYENDGTYTPVTHTEKTVNYRAKNEVIIGTEVIFFKEAVIEENGTLLLPYEQLREELRTAKHSDETVAKDGVLYIAVDKLVDCGFATKVNTSGGRVTITPANTGTDLLLPDDGEISHYAEYISYLANLSTEIEKGTDDLVYKLTPANESKDSGIIRFITDEIHKFGQGTYRLKLKLKGESAGKLAITTSYGGKTVDVGKEWKEYDLNFKVTSDGVNKNSIQIVINGAGTHALKYFCMKDMTLKKIS